MRLGRTEDGVGVVVDRRERETSSAQARAVVEAVRAAVERGRSLACFVAPGVPDTVLKATSGKLRRRTTRDARLGPSPPAYLYVERRAPLDAAVTRW